MTAMHARLALAGLIRSSGSDRAADRRGRRGDRAARGDAPLHRELPAKRLGGGRAPGSARLAGSRLLGGAGATRGSGSRQAAGRGTGLGNGDRAVRILDPHRPGRQHDHSQRLHPRRPRELLARHPHLPPAPRLAEAGRRRPRPADGRDPPGPDRRHRQAHSAARLEAPALQGHRRRPYHRPRSGLPAAESLGWPHPRAAARERGDHAVRDVQANARSAAAAGHDRQRAGQLPARRSEGRPVAGAGAARPRPARGGQPVRGASRSPARPCFASSARSRAACSSSTTSPTR